ncbi:outer membrane protein assembly factor BamC [Nitrosospira multiformis]|uniref:NlpBDapX lipoprotein n=2 Tax=Nitrosospira multiformis (strain ATCC 25196 / NCIMB 11849 / C 71) TaxID=323848 RepID=Q2Y8S9_NITMU|nr:outer membrane protein assembly factor BamC [Nitrosospira multiformis]ABB74842.1 NlpBDapX lipoprotein [Nitrosospira multiformis ATCC 25196]
MRSQIMAALCLAAAVAGCSVFSEILPEAKKINYKSAGKLPPLEIPPDLTAPGSDERYHVPDISPTGVATFSAYNKERSKTAGITAGGTPILPSMDEAGVRMERSGTQRWLVVNGEPEEIWPIVRDFWQELGFLIKIEMPEAGVMETDWAENRAKIPEDILRNTLGKLLDSLYSTGERDKFRTRLERGENGTTEIYISHRGMDEVIEGANVRTVWQPRPSDPDLEAEMLSRLMMRFGVTEERARSAVASTGVQERARLNGEKGGILTVTEAFDRSWRRVGLALDRIGFTVEDRNRSQGVYFVRYVNPEAENGAGTGLLSKLAFWRDEDSDKPGQYRIQLSEAGTNTDVTVLNKDGVAEDSSDAKRILKLLYEQLK